MGRWAAGRLLLALLLLVGWLGPPRPAAAMATERRRQLAAEVREMFYHAYDGYLRHAFPKDELRPMSCTGVDRFGGVLLTLVDSLDMLVVLQNHSEFARAVHLVGTTLSFQKDAALSVFETNIRVLGGLLSAHHFAEKLLPGYDGALLARAVELGDILLLAFDTPTGIPYNEVNPRSGPNQQERTTCPAAAGTLMLEFGYLSALTGKCKYLLAARRALDALWMRRSPLDLWGTVIDVLNGQWQVADADVGASTDSLYEYLLKASLFFEDDRYFLMYEAAYNGAEQHLKRADWYIKVNCHSGSGEKLHVNSLQAFWPGMQVLAGDLPGAIAAWNRFHCLASVHGFVPEKVLLDSAVVQERGYPLRPEFLESTMFLFEATGDHRYLDVAERMVRRLQTLRTECGYAALKDVTTGELEDKMDSFFLAETLKYLYLMLLPEDHLDLRRHYLFNTEAHPFPITLATVEAHSKCTSRAVQDACDVWTEANRDQSAEPEAGPQCKERPPQPAVQHATRSEASPSFDVQALDLAETCNPQAALPPEVLRGLRQQQAALHGTDAARQPPPKCSIPLAADIFFGMEDIDPASCMQMDPAQATTCQRGAEQQQPVKGNQLLQVQMDGKTVVQLGITGAPGLVEILQTPAGAVVAGVAPEHLYLATLPFSLKLRVPDHDVFELQCAAAGFGPTISMATDTVTDIPVFYPSSSTDGCSTPTDHFPERGTQFAVLFDRGSCPFQRKVEHGQAAGAALVIVANHLEETALLSMAGDVDSTNVSLIVTPAVFIVRRDADVLKQALQRPHFAATVTLGRHSPAVLRRYGIDPLPVGPTGVLLRRTGPPAPGAPAPAALDRATTPPPGWPAGPAAENAAPPEPSAAAAPGPPHPPPTPAVPPHSAAPPAPAEAPHSPPDARPPPTEPAPGPDPPEEPPGTCAP